MNSRNTLKANAAGHLEIGGCDALRLAERFGTPLYVYDEQYIRNMMRVFKDTIDKYYGGNGNVLYASKAFSCLAMYRIAEQEGIGCDAVSGGELYTALKAGFNAKNIYVHGNNKTYEELVQAVEAGVGGVVIDSYREADILNEIAAEHKVKQPVLIRVNPGVEAHTHAFVQTARTDSKFGFSIRDNTALDYTKHVLSLKNLNLKGYHCHIGSQIFEKQSFSLAAQNMIDFMSAVKSEVGFEAEILNMGGGFGIYYTDEDPKFTESNYAEYLLALINTVKDRTKELNMRLPYLLIEPGRSIVGEAGITLYTVGSIKDIPGIRKYVAIDGGMFENPRYSLYQSKYTVLKAADVNAENIQKVSIAGKCCESGDLIGVDIPLPEVESGDILAVLSTGAYHYSMASNYNRNFIPQAVLVKDGKAETIIKKQTFEDLVRNDVVPDSLK
ncbi:MAG: diaminopimelate decarboxylase [Clostridiales bacterium]|nr:diaminopimelate decarboxylase [Clostridiales bacterium]